MRPLLVLATLLTLATCDPGPPVPPIGLSGWRPEPPAFHCPEEPGALLDGEPCTVHGECSSCRCAAAGAGTEGIRSSICVPACSAPGCGAGERCGNVAADGEIPRGGCIPADTLNAGAPCEPQWCGVGGRCRSAAQGDVCFRDCAFEPCDDGACVPAGSDGDGFCRF